MSPYLLILLAEPHQDRIGLRTQGNWVFHLEYDQMCEEEGDPVTKLHKLDFETEKRNRRDAYHHTHSSRLINMPINTMIS